jgi:gliding motility-associated-like protein
LPNSTLSKLKLICFSVLIPGARIAAQLPSANFTATPVSGCSPLTVRFTDQSEGNPFSWNWDFGNGQLSTQQNPTVTYYTAGSYTVKLVVKNASGLDDEVKTGYITVAPSPTAAFTSNLTVACNPGIIQFSDQSTSPAAAGTIVSWLWDFGDGTTSTQQNPSHMYTTTGYFTVALTVTSSSGCQHTRSVGRYIRIVGGVSASFYWSQPSTCQAPYTINFQNQSDGPGTLSYLWNFGNGGSTSTLENPSATYPSEGNYSVTLQVHSSMGCSGSTTKNVPLAGKTTDFNVPSSICVGQTITFQNNSTPAPVSSQWNFGDGTTSSQVNPQKAFFSTGSYPVKLKNNYGNCIDSVTKNVVVTNQPPVNFTANDSGSCQAPFTVQFADLSPSAATWLWEFGDGNTSSQQNPSHVFSSPGSFDVTLTITLPGGCTNTITKHQYIKIASANVGIANAPAGGCIPYSYTPVAQIQSVDSIVSYAWDMGEPGAVYTNTSPTHIYTAAGDYNITLTIITQNGCSDTAVFPAAVRTGTRPGIDFNFTPNNVCASTPIQFTDLTTTTAGAFVRWQWDFGDGNTSGEQNPVHVFEDTGRLFVQLTVSNNGCKDSLSKPLTVFPPVAIFGYKVNCNNRLQVTFLDSSLVNPVYGPVSYQWKMGDPANTIFNTAIPPTFTYPSFGTYTATLTVTNGSCSYQTTKEIILLNETPNFTVDKNPVCKTEMFVLTALVSDTAKFVDYSWNIGGAIFNDTTKTISYSLPAYGNYPVSLVVEDINGCTNTKTISDFIEVRGPVAHFSPDRPGACVNGTIGFTDQSTGGVINSWTWNYGDGTQTSYSSPPFSHNYNQTGSYTVRLMIRDTANCADTISIPHSVLITDPVAAFDADSFYCPMAPLQFVDTSSGTGLSYEWSFGDGGNSILSNPIHTYPVGDSVYTVRLIITDTVGCKDTVIHPNCIRIRSPQPAFTLQDSAGICLPTVVNFNFLGQHYQSFYWEFGDGESSTSENPSHFYNTYGLYTPKLFLVGPGGCIDSAESTITVYDPAESTQINAGPTTGCQSITTNFSINTLAGFKFKFYFGDGSVDSSQQLHLTHVYQWPGNYYPYIILTDNYGCESGANGTPIRVYGALPVFAMNKKEFCDSGQVFFINHSFSNDPIVSTTWNFGDGNTSNDIEPSHRFSPPGSYIITLTLTTQQQCTSTSKDTVKIYPTPDLHIGGRDSICINSPEVYTGILALPDSTTKWNWSFGNGSTSVIQNPAVTYSATGNYDIRLNVANKLGCADSSAKPVHVVPKPVAQAVVDPLQINSGGSAQLNMNYSGPIISYHWSPRQNISCDNCPAPAVNPQFTTKYTVDVTDRYGCTSQGFITVRVICNGQNFFIPNTFSPNDDGMNDVFYLRGSGLFRVKSLRVFNRWGEVVFEKMEVPVNNPSYGWNGNYKGEKAPPGVYVYQLEIICSNGELLAYSGNIALMR